MKKKFDISMRPQIESGEYKVVTRGGQPVRIVCYDRKGKFNIIALIDDGYIECKEEYTPDGCLLQDKSEHRLDLFVIIPEPEMTEFEKGIYDMMVDRTNEATISEEYARRYSSKLLELARKELQPEYDATKIDESLVNRMLIKWCDRKLARDVPYSGGESDAYIEGLRDMYKQLAHLIEDSKRQYDKGYGDCLAKMPMWGKMENQNFTGRMCTDYFLLDNGYKIRLSDLQKLPKQDEQ